MSGFQGADSPGTASAKLRFVQVQFTEFSSDSFPLPIELRSAIGGGISEEATNITGGTLPTGEESSQSIHRLTIEHPTSRKRKGPQFSDPKAGIIGASCLSIIGMIRPGRTVRLYRQIH